MIKKLQEKLSENEAVIIIEPKNRRYFTGINTSNGLLLVTADSAVFFTDFRYITAAKSNLPKNITPELFSGGRSESIKTALKDKNCEKIYFEGNYLSYNEVKILKENLYKYTLINGGDTILSLREIKTEEEIGYIKQAQRITDKGFTFICNYIRENKRNRLTEKMIAFELEIFMRKNGSGAMPFEIIAASGPNSALPHAVPTDRKIVSGDFLTLDFGSTVNGYASDMTRTVAIDNVSDKQMEIYNIVLKAQKTALKKIKPGMTGKEVDSIARDIIEEEGYGEYFGHSLGHGVGLDVHENPNFAPRWTDPIPENAVMSVEPGIYLEDEFGVRIEDLCVIRKNGVEDLTGSDKSLIIL